MNLSPNPAPIRACKTIFTPACVKMTGNHPNSRNRWPVLNSPRPLNPNLKTEIYFGIMYVISGPISGTWHTDNPWWFLSVQLGANSLLKFTFVTFVSYRAGADEYKIPKMIVIIDTRTQECKLFTTKTGAAESIGASSKSIERGIKLKRPVKKFFLVYFGQVQKNKKLKRKANF